jgi:hypothetical protein
MTTATGTRGTAIAGVPVAFVAIWIAIFGVAAILPAIPLVGGGTFGGQEFIFVLAGVLFGPVGGLVAGALGGLLASFIGPATAYFGLATFYGYAAGGLVAGILVRARRVELIALGIAFAILLVLWPILPWTSAIGAYVYAHNANWPLHVTGFLGILGAPWPVKQIRTFEPARFAVGLVVITWATMMIQHVVINYGWAILYPVGPEAWVTGFWTGIVPAQRVILTIVTTIIGTALIIGLHRAGIRFAPESGSILSEPVAEPERA